MWPLLRLTTLWLTERLCLYFSATEASYSAMSSGSWTLSQSVSSWPAEIGSGGWGGSSWTELREATQDVRELLIFNHCCSAPPDRNYTSGWDCCLLGWTSIPPTLNIQDSVITNSDLHLWRSLLTCFHHRHLINTMTVLLMCCGVFSAQCLVSTSWLSFCCLWLKTHTWSVKIFFFKFPTALFFPC